jgi:hypothetical protein
MKEIQLDTICNRKFEIGNSLSVNPVIPSKKILSFRSKKSVSIREIHGSKMRAVARRWLKVARRWHILARFGRAVARRGAPKSARSRIFSPKTRKIPLFKT